ncbi:MAG TPA: ABC transporter substrate binding protein [Methylomirabilota bacterium]|nr:ABC transporter substrate binding protein [Methylomirabilota bacterium]
MAMSLVILVLGLFGPFAAGAQQTGQMRRIGVLMGLPEDPWSEARLAAFRKGLKTLGWEEGRNIRLDVRWATTSDAPSMERLARELVALQPDVLLSHNTPTTSTLLRHTRAIPIVCAVVSDPVGTGFVSSFPRPGRNVTGFTNIEPTMAGKWPELLTPARDHQRDVYRGVRILRAQGRPPWPRRH